nr:DDE-type integrase/transposase/recombinase [Streptomonospora alba]
MVPPNADVPLGGGQVGRPPVLVMVLGYSRLIMARMLPSRRAADLTAGTWALLEQLGACPTTLVWDNESGIGRWRGRDAPRLSPEFAGLAGSLGVGVRILRPRDPEAKGVVERANRYLATSFEPGRHYVGPADFNAQLGDWRDGANTRIHQRLRCRPTERLEADRAAMVALPAQQPEAVGHRWETCLARDHYIRLDTCDYSVHPWAVGRRVAVRADLEAVRVWRHGHLVADHARCWAAHQTLSDAAHLRAATALRTTAIHAGAAPQSDEVQQRDLASYDRHFGTAEEVVA